MRKFILYLLRGSNMPCLLQSFLYKPPNPLFITADAVIIFNSKILNNFKYGSDQFRNSSHQFGISSRWSTFLIYIAKVIRFYKQLPDSILTNRLIVYITIIRRRSQYIRGGSKVNIVNGSGSWWERRRGIDRRGDMTLRTRIYGLQRSYWRW